MKPTSEDSASDDQIVLNDVNIGDTPLDAVNLIKSASLDSIVADKLPQNTVRVSNLPPNVISTSAPSLSTVAAAYYGGTWLDRLEQDHIISEQRKRLNDMSRQLDDLQSLLKNPEELARRIEKIQQELKSSQKGLESLQASVELPSEAEMTIRLVPDHKLENLRQAQSDQDAVMVVLGACVGGVVGVITNWATSGTAAMMPAAWALLICFAAFCGVLVLAYRRLQARIREADKSLKAGPRQTVRLAQVGNQSAAGLEEPETEVGTVCN